MNADDAERSTFSFVRKSKDGKNNLLFVINFTPVAREDYRVGVPKYKSYKLILNSEDSKFNGSDTNRPTSYRAAKKPIDGKDYSIAYPLPAYGVAVFKF
jgi:1,4-alpha-glucan branching enzyme